MGTHVGCAEQRTDRTRGLNVEDKEGGVKVASHLPNVSGEKESQRWEIFGVKMISSTSCCVKMQTI